MAFQSVETALRTLYAAHKYQCPELVQKCVDYLSQNLNVNNILSILSNIPLLCGNVQNLEVFKVTINNATFVNDTLVRSIFLFIAELGT